MTNEDNYQNCEFCRSGRRVQFVFYEPTDIYCLGQEDPVASPITHQTREIEYTYVCDPRDIMDGRMLFTGDFAPLFEMGPRAKHAFHRLMENNHTFSQAQIEANKRIFKWEDDAVAIRLGFGNGDVSPQQRISDDPQYTLRWNTTSTTATTGGADTTWLNYRNDQWYQGTSSSTIPSHNHTGITDPTRQEWFTSTDTLDWQTQEQLWPMTGSFRGNDRYEVKKALFKLFTKVPRVIIKKMTEDEKKMLAAKKKSEELVLSWLSPNERKALFKDGEIRVQSKDPDVVYIMKKDPNERVVKEVKGRPVERMCVVAEDLESPVGDQFLSKYFCLKHDEEDFKRLAICSPIRS